MSNFVVTIRCSKCAGHGRIHSFRHIDHGECWDCGGLGVEDVTCASDYAAACVTLNDYLGGGVCTVVDVWNALVALGDKARGAQLLREFDVDREDLIAAYRAAREAA